MKKLYQKFFYVPKYGKVRDKVMVARTVTSVAVMVGCLIALSISAYAYFSANVTSGPSVIKAANFEANVSVTITDPNNGTEPVIIRENQIYDLKAGTYTVSLIKGDSTAKTGFCIVTIGEKEYHTQQLGVDTERQLEDASVTFTLKLSGDTRITFLSHWGTSCHYGYDSQDNNPHYIKEGSTLDLTATPSDNTPSGGGQGVTEETTPNTTTPSTDTPPESTTQESDTPPTTETEPAQSTPETSAHTETGEPTDTNEDTQSTETTTETTGTPTNEANE